MVVILAFFLMKGNSLLPIITSKLTLMFAVHDSFSLGVAIYCDFEGDFLFAWTKKFFSGDHLVGEARAALLVI
jgi:hypothetical protein